MKKIRWAIMGTGTIAKNFAKGLQRLDDAELYAVASLSIESAIQFSQNYEAQKSCRT
ncbi:hypothetical protein [Pectobacterium jejuense]|uniref:Gfo/Idh/MocA-like oxidoreductase N-terminal domain-containing protein n=1 Tax=Pectobacterium jejuense TaxID=2974022 RepID=A0ABW8GVL8_9GAMM|nr:hypothetical protein [Pectobacterium jejuense]MCY9848972.1 hypothetical protein [Pectobacterium jejuense]